MRNKFGFLLVLVFLLSMHVTVWASPLVRIGIVNGKDSVIISGQRSFAVIDALDQTIAKGQKNEKWNLEYRNGQIYLNDRLTKTPLVFRMEPGDDNEYLMVDGRRYRGELEIRVSATKKGITVIETLPMEEYIYGIIPWEISPAWPVEAVKAQAIAARTYALYYVGKHKKDGFDLCNTTDCQAYGGREAEDPRGNWAVDATQGMVVTYNNKLVPTYFHSSGGGYTENIENVWSAKIDYLRAVPDFDQGSPYFNWQTAYTSEEISDRLQSAGYDIGVFQGIKLSPLREGINDATDRGVSGRVKTVTFIGNKQNVTLSGNEVRQLFKLSSTLFDIRLPESIKEPINKETVNKETTEKPKQENNKPLISKTPNFSSRIQDIVREFERSTTTRKEIATSNKSNPKIAAANTRQKQDPAKVSSSAEHVISPATAISITFVGHGSGHGLGLSQWGAKAMAEQGPKGDHTYYQQILKHYYQGIDITKWY
jgi:stage II sporulation protein D